MSDAVIAGGHEHSCNVAMEVMHAGGNVIDAAISALATMFIAEPAMASAGGGGFAAIRLNGHPIQIIDFFCQTPLVKKEKKHLEFRPILVDFGDDQELFYSGNGTAAVPGTIAGIYKMHELFGSMPLTELFQPAIELMKHGLRLDEFQQYYLSLLQDIFLFSSEGKEIFQKDGQLIQTGDRITMPELADFLDTLALEGKDLFYKGEAGKELAEIHAEQGGLLTRADLARYQVETRKPTTFNKNGWQFYTVPFPFLGGPVIQVIMDQMNEIYTDPKSNLYELSRIFQKLVHIHKDQAELKKVLSTKVLPEPKHKGSTSHFSIIDDSGNSVSLTTSIGEGSGLFLSKSGIHINNMLGELALLPGDLHSWTSNSRLNSRMSPTIGVHGNGDILSLGTGGAGRIPYVIAQFLVHFLSDYPRVDIEEIVQWPRIFCTSEVIHMENTIEAESLYCKNLDSKTWSAQSIFFGGINAVGRKGQMLIAAADPRRKGHVLYKK